MDGETNYHLHTHSLLYTYDTILGSIPPYPAPSIQPPPAEANTETTL